jgi:hypothetical protein
MIGHGLRTKNKKTHQGQSPRVLQKIEGPNCETLHWATVLGDVWIIHIQKMGIRHKLVIFVFQCPNTNFHFTI